MLVARYEHRTFTLREREEIVVVWVRGTGHHDRGVVGQGGMAPDQSDVRAGFTPLETTSELFRLEGALELVEQPRRRDELVLAASPTSHDLTGRSASGEQRRDEDVRVEYRPHSVSCGLSHLVLRLERE